MLWGANDGGQAIGFWGPFAPAARECYGIKIPVAPSTPVVITPFNNPTFDISRTLTAPINLTGITSVIWSARLRALSGVQLLDAPPGPIPAFSFTLTGNYQILLDTILIGSGSWSGGVSITPGGGSYWGFQNPDIRDNDTAFQQIGRTETVGTVRFMGSVLHDLPSQVPPFTAETRIALEMYLLRST